jgi:hypothetical protein
MDPKNPTPPADGGEGKNNPPADNKGGSGAGNGTPPDNKGAGDGAVDLSKLSDEQLAKVFDDERVWKHPRFKQLSDEAKEGRKLKLAQEEAEKKRLEEQGEFKQLLEQERARNKELTLNTQIQAAAIKAGAVDVEAVTKLIDRNAITIKDDGTVEGISEAVTALLESKPYLKGTGAPAQPSVGSGGNPPADANTQGKYKFKHSQILDPKFYADNEAAILEAMKNNQIENDLP